MSNLGIVGRLGLDCERRAQARPRYRIKIPARLADHAEREQLARVNVLMLRWMTMPLERDGLGLTVEQAARCKFWRWMYLDGRSD